MLAWSGPAPATTRPDALAAASRGNPQIAAARARLAAAQAEVAIAQATGRPRLSLNGSAQLGVGAGSDAFAPTDPDLIASSARLEIPLSQGGGVTAMVAAARARVGAATADLSRVEGEVLTDVARVFVDVLAAEAGLDVQRTNVAAIEAERKADSARRSRGDATWTDVRQAEARLATAEGRVAQAIARVVAAGAQFEALTGLPPIGLAEPFTPPTLATAPVTRDRQAMLREADAHNPALASARALEDATRFDVAAAAALRRPRLSLVGEASVTRAFRGDGPYPFFPDATRYGRQVSFGIALTVPLFAGGGPTARLRQARALEAQASEAVIAADRMLVADLGRQLALLHAAEAGVPLAETSVTASHAALIGVQKERTVGLRTSLDVLNAQQEASNSDLGLIAASQARWDAQLQLRRLLGQTSNPSDDARPEDAEYAQLSTAARSATAASKAGTSGRRPPAKLAYDFAGLANPEVHPPPRLAYARLL